jgi:hypothetical protein
MIDGKLVVFLDDRIQAMAERWRQWIAAGMPELAGELAFGNA